MEDEQAVEVYSDGVLDADETLPEEVNDVFNRLDPLAFRLVQFATDSSCNDHIDQSTRYQIETFLVWMKRMLSYFSLNWDEKKEPCPVLGLLAILEIAGTEKGKTVGNTTVLGCGQSLSQLTRIRKFVSRINEENGFTERKIYPEDYEVEQFRGQPMNSAYHDFIVKCMKKFKKKISRREVQAQAFLRYHLILVRKSLMEKGLFGMMMYTAILFSFWLCLRVGVLLTIRIENIEIGTTEVNALRLPLFLKVKVKMQKVSNTYKVFRLWSYAEEDVEVCPVFHFFLLLKLTGWRHGFLFRRPLLGAHDASMRFNYSQSDPMNHRLYYTVYNNEFKALFFDSEYRCSCHGPRRSQAQLLDRCGFSLLHIMVQCLWKNAEDAMKYIANSRVDLELLPEEHRREFPRPKPVHC